MFTSFLLVGKRGTVTPSSDGLCGFVYVQVDCEDPLSVSSNITSLRILWGLWAKPRVP